MLSFLGGDFYGFLGSLGFLGSSWSHLPPPVVLLDDDDGPLLLPSHLQLGDVRLVLPPENDGDDENDDDDNYGDDNC